MQGRPPLRARRKAAKEPAKRAMVSGVRVWPTTPRHPETESMRGAGVGLVEGFDMRGEGRGWVGFRAGVEVWVVLGVFLKNK